MTSALTPADVLKLLPHRRPCSFVDEILELDSEHALTKYTWREEEAMVDAGEQRAVGSP